MSNWLEPFLESLQEIHVKKKFYCINETTTFFSFTVISKCRPRGRITISNGWCDLCLWGHGRRRVLLGRTARSEGPCTFQFPFRGPQSRRPSWVRPISCWRSGQTTWCTWCSRQEGLDTSFFFDTLPHLLIDQLKKNNLQCVSSRGVIFFAGPVSLIIY